MCLLDATFGAEETTKALRKKNILHRISLFKPQHNNSSVFLLLLLPGTEGSGAGSQGEPCSSGALITA